MAARPSRFDIVLISHIVSAQRRQRVETGLLFGPCQEVAHIAVVEERTQRFPPLTRLLDVQG